MNLDENALIASLFIGLIGAACFIYGRKQARLPQMLVGVTMCIYPYFVPNVALMGAIAVLLLVMLWGAVRLGF